MCLPFTSSEARLRSREGLIDGMFLVGAYVSGGGALPESAGMIRRRFNLSCFCCAADDLFFSCALLWFHLLRRQPGVVCEASGGSAASPPWWQPDWLTVGESTPVQRRRHVEATHDVDDATRKRSDDTQGSVKRRLVCVFLMDFDVMPCSTRVVSAFRTFLS
jgi:hypothetical protein